MELRAQFFDSYGSGHSPSGLGVFRDALAYETVMLMHRAFTSAQYHGYEDMFTAFSEQGPFTSPTSDMGPRRASGLMLVNVFNSRRSGGVESIPKTGWLAEMIIRIRQSEDFILERIRQNIWARRSKRLMQPLSVFRTHPLRKEELHRLARTSVSSRGCMPEMVSVSVPRTILTPRRNELYGYSLDGFPRMAIFPVQSGIRVRLECASDISSAETKAAIEYACVPNNDDGDLTCLVSTPPPPPPARSRREVSNTRADSQPAILSKVRGVFSDAFSAWRGMVPSALSCTGSLAGCDFCLYFFATYNVSAHPNVCLSGCALGTVGSCTSLIGTSVTETYRIMTEEEK